MDIKAVIRNVRKLGVKGVFELKNERNNCRKNLEQVVVEYRSLFTNRPYAQSSDKDFYQSCMKRAKELEDALSIDKTQRREILAECKAHYLKNLIPELYKNLSVKPIEHKLIFMENGWGPTSPTSAHLIDVLRSSGDYEIHTLGLKKSYIAELEYYENALRFIKDAATAKAIFITTANDVFSHVTMRSESKLIQLWHGVGMFKRVGWSTVDKEFGMGVAERTEYDQYRNYSYVTIAGKAQAWTFEDAMRIPADSGVIVPVGISRTDVFYNAEYREIAYKKLYEVFPQAQGKKIIFYAPTFRGSTSNAKGADRLDINAFGNALSNDYVLLIRQHGLVKEAPYIPAEWKNFAFDVGERRRLLTIEQLLAIADICITDYSSIGFEFAIMERPLIFFAYDLEDYLDKRGMYYDYDEITPGPICKTNEEMIDYISHIDERFDKQAIVDFKQKYVNACDGHATERTIALIES